MIAYTIEASGFIRDTPEETDDFDLAWSATDAHANEHILWDLLKAADETFTVNLERTFQELVGPTRLSADCYFGLGLQGADAPLMPWRPRMAIRASELLRRASATLPFMVHAADSVYVDSIR